MLQQLYPVILAWIVGILLVLGGIAALAALRPAMGFRVIQAPPPVDGNVPQQRTP